MTGSPTTASLTRLCAALLLFSAPGAASAQEMTFQSVIDEAKEFAGPGADGFYGVEDDDDLSGVGVNPNGSLSYVYLNEIDLGGLTEFLSAGEGTLAFDALPFDVPAVVNDFDFETLDALTNAPLFDQKDVAPHELLFLGNGFYFWNYTATLCGARETREECNAFVEVDITGNGWVWRPGIDDPTALPVDDSTEFGARLLAFFQYVETVVPEGTTAISVGTSNPIQLTAENTRGSGADSVIGGSLFAVNTQFSTDPVPEEIDCQKKAKLCGKTLELGGSSQLKIKGGETVGDDEFSLSVVLAKKNWAGFDSRGFLNYGSYKTKKKDRQAVLKYDTGDLGFIFNALGGVVEAEVDKKSSVIDVKLNKKRSKVKQATMKSKSKGVVDALRRKVTYRVDLKGTVEESESE